MQPKKKATAAPIELPPGNCHLVADNWCQTMSKKTKVDFQWTIEYLSLQFRNSSTSHFFYSDEDPNVKWYLNIKRKNKEVTLHRYQDKEYAVLSPENPTQVYFAFVNKKGEQVHKSNQSLPGFSKMPLSLVVISEETLSKSDDLIFDDGTLTILCVIETFNFYSLSGKSAGFRCQQEVESYDELISRIDWLFHNIGVCDVTLDVQGRKFQAHKSILSAKSPVFEAMFTHDTAEKQSHHVDVPDIDPDVFHEVLRFVYTGRVNKLDEMATGLLAAADKYILDSLKQLCVNHLKMTRMSAENCINLLLVDDHHPAEELKKNAVEMFRRDVANVMATETWQKIKAEQPGKLFAILEMAFNNSG